MNEKTYNLISNYYKGELASLSFKLISSFFVLSLFFLLLYFYNSETIMYFSTNGIILFALIFAKSVYQWVEYFFRRKRILSDANFRLIDEFDFIKKRESILTSHRRIHVYSVILIVLSIFAVLIYDSSLIKIVGLLGAFFLASSKLLSFSLFNSFRLSEYKQQIKDAY